MKKTIIAVGIGMLLVTAILQMGGRAAVWAGEGKFLFSSVSNNTWVLDTSTRQLILINFEKPDKTWKSKPVSVPAGFDVNQSRLKAVGVRGTAVVLQDTSSGLVTFFDAKDDGSIVAFEVIDIKDSMK